MQDKQEEIQVLDALREGEARKKKQQLQRRRRMRDARSTQAHNSLCEKNHTRSQCSGSLCL